MNFRFSNRNWNDFYSELKRIYSDTGKLPNFQTKNVHINRWLDDQCDALAAGKLSKEHEGLLRAVGFDFVKTDTKRFV